MVWSSTPFYHQLIRKYIVVFGSFFTDLMIERNVPGGDAASQVIKVPLQYGAKEKMLTRLVGDPNTDRPFAIQLPIMTFELKTMKYIPERKLNSIHRTVRHHPTNKNAFKTIFEPVPYDFFFSLSVFVKNAEDACKIVEQILPFFTPDWTVSVELIPDMQEVRDIPVVLENTTIDDVMSNDFKERRTMIWTLDFVMHGYLYGPERDKPMIKFITETFTTPDPNSIEVIPYPQGANTSTSEKIDIDTTTGQPAFQVTTQPGKDANGNPTTSVNNSIDWKLIDLNDTWGFAAMETDVTPVSTTQALDGSNTQIAINAALANG